LSLFSNNVSLFFNRFSSLADYLGIKKEDLFQNGDINSEIPNSEYVILPSEIEIIPSKVSGVFTAKANGKFLHSLYNPIREAEQIVDNIKKNSPDSKSCAFFGFGLGHSVVSYAKRFPLDSLLIVEPNPKMFFTALAYVDWTSVFELKNVVIALASGADVVVSIIENFGGLEKCAIVSNPNHTFLAESYFHALNTQIERNKEKDLINKATLERFSKIWKRNISKNVEFLKKLLSSSKKLVTDISKYSNTLLGKNVLILAAGPTLSEILPYLKEIKKRTVIIAVDTALRACLSVGVEPDFIVLCDPQYYAYRHIAGLSSKSSVLITELAVYPPVMRFPCKEISLCSSNCPLDKLDFDSTFIEKDKKRGYLSSGGSVSTTAWDFARFCGATNIFFAGLDLGFPKNETHIRGSTFEEIVHMNSNKLKSAETSNVASLFGANILIDVDYDGNKILTDNRMKMFAWWFESKATEYSQIKTYSLSSKSLKIPGFEISDFSKI